MLHTWAVSSNFPDFNSTLHQYQPDKLPKPRRVGSGLVQQPVPGPSELPRISRILVASVFMYQVAASSCFNQRVCEVSIWSQRREKSLKFQSTELCVPSDSANLNKNGENGRALSSWLL